MHTIVPPQNPPCRATLLALDAPIGAPREHRRRERGDPRHAPPAFEGSVDPNRRATGAGSVRDAAKAKAVWEPIGREPGGAPRVVSVGARGGVHPDARPQKP